MELQLDHKNMTPCGSASWTAPEILRGETYTEKADVYSFAIVMWECLTRQEPHHGMEVLKVIMEVGNKGLRLEIPATASHKWKELITQCWSEIPENRPD